MSRIVVKFGGTSVGSGKRIKRAARSVAKEFDEGHEIVVVVSAMGDTTDRLIDDMQEIEPGYDDECEILSMGERTSVRFFKAALTKQGIDASFVEPGMDNWPVILKDNGEINLAETKKEAEGIEEKLGGEVPVVCGFVGETTDGKVRTLGRGGSDTTAMLLGNVLDADEVVIVTDVEGIMTGDPESIDEARSVDSISVDEMQDLSLMGAKVIAPSALNYKKEDMNVRIVHHRHGDIFVSGTEIEGEGENGYLVESREQNLAAVTVAGRSILDTPNLLARLSTVLGEEGINIYGHSTGSESMTFFLDKEEGEKAEKLIHNEVVDDSKFSSVSSRDNVGMVMVTGGEFEDTQGVVYRVVQPLNENDINILEILSSITSIVVFVELNEKEEAVELLEKEFEVK